VVPDVIFFEHNANHKYLGDHPRRFFGGEIKFTSNACRKKQIYISLHGLHWIQNYFHNVSEINIMIFIDTLGCYSTIILVLQICIARVNLAKSYIDVLQYFIWLQISPSINFSLAEMQIFFLNLTYSYMAMTVLLLIAKKCKAGAHNWVRENLHSTHEKYTVI